MSDVVIKRTRWGWSMYVTADMTDDPYDGLISSCDDFYDQIAYAREEGLRFEVREA